MKNKLILTITITTLLLTGALSYHFYSAKSALKDTGAGRLVGWWTMDTGDKNGTMYYDRSGNGNHATAINSPTIVQGKIGQASKLIFSSTQRFTAPTISIPSAVTVSVWAYSTDFARSMFMVEKSPVNAQWSLFFESTLVWRGGDANSLTCPAPKGNQWHHIVGQQTGTTATLYIDGVQCNSGGPLAAIANGSGQIDIGAYTLEGGVTPGYLFDGYLDDVRIYNYALSAQEVSQLYNSAKTTYTASAPKTASSTAQLVGWWTMDAGDINGTAMYDKSGNRNNITGVNITSADLTTGKINQAIDFDGSTEYFSRGALSPVIPDNGPASFSAWIKLDQKASTKGSLQSIMHGVLYIHNGNDYFYISDDYSSCGLLGARVGQWMHIVVTWSGDASTAKLYIDNRTPCTFAQQGGTWDTMSFSTFRIGYLQDSGAFFDGSIDDVRIYNYALSAQDVSNLYNSAKTKYTASAPKEGLIGWWSMDTQDMNPTGAVIYDKSGKQRNIALTGSTTSTGKIGQARKMNGSTDKMVVAVFPQGDALTYAVWVKTTAVPGAGDVVMDTEALGALDAGMGIFTNDGLDLNCRVDDLSAQSNLSLAAGTPTDGLWHHIVCTKDDADLVTIYIDGAQRAQNTLTIANISQSGSLGIGVRSSGDFPWPGHFDDARVYNRALSAQEVSNLYESARRTYVQ